MSAEDRHDEERPAERLTIRMLGDADLTAVRRLAERDSSPLPTLPLLGAELDGDLIAAMPLDGRSRSIADPFRPSGDARALLESRARQLRAAAAGRGGGLKRLLRPRPVAAQASSSGAIVSPAEASCSQ